MASNYYAKLDIAKLRRDTLREIQRIGVTTIEKGLNEADKVQIGAELVEAMKDQIAKGISPIQGKGRFPAYKWVAKANQILKGGRATASKDARTRRRKFAADTKKKGYPYSVRGQYPSKRERPVNLFLSGKFMNDLTAKSVRGGGVLSVFRRRVMRFGFFKDLSAKKEEGHRVGVNSQPSRPTIPTGAEQLNRTVYNRLLVAISRRIRLAVQRSIRKS